MKDYRHKMLSAALVTCAAVIVLAVCCNDDTDKNSSGSTGPAADSYDPVFNADGGFVITYGMLDKRFNEITFPGTHNSYAGIGSNWLPECKCQGLTISDQLKYGIRYIEFDIDDLLYVRHGTCTGYLNERLEEVRDYALAHPNQVILARIADLGAGLGALESYERVNGRLENTGLASLIFNWNPSKPKDDPGRCYMPDPWPTLRDMIESGKNVMFLHTRLLHNVVDEGLTHGLSYSDLNAYIFYDAQDQEQFCRLMPFWDPPTGRQLEGASRLFLLECEPDGGAYAGDQEDAAKNDDGRRLYQVAKQHEVEILPGNRVVNFVIVDYFMSSHAGHLPIDVVDACNRLNYERFKANWKTSPGFWESYPYEFDNTKVDYISLSAGVQTEVEQARNVYRNHQDLDGFEDAGQVVATTYHTNYDWKRIPEWAVDNDMFTRWCGSSSGNNHTWGIDLGQRRNIDEVAIAWEFSHKRPAYTVYASTSDNLFADGISNQELLDDQGWTVVAQGAKLTNNYGLLWDRQDIEDNGGIGWRYFKIKVTDADSEHWPSFWEVKLYGPAQ